jgi:hypothetical protein
MLQTSLRKKKRQWRGKIIYLTDESVPTLVLYDTKSEREICRFDTPQDIHSGIVSQLANDDFVILFTHGSRVIQFSNAGRVLFEFSSPIGSGNANCVLNLHDNTIFVGYDECIRIFRPDRSFIHINDKASSVIQIQDGKIVTVRNKLCIWTSSMQLISTHKLAHEKLQLRGIIEYKPNCLAIGGDNGVFTFDMITNEIQRSTENWDVPSLVNLSYAERFVGINHMGLKVFTNNICTATYPKVLKTVWPNAVIEYEPGRILCQSGDYLAIVDVSDGRMERLFEMKEKYLRMIVLE